MPVDVPNSPKDEFAEAFGEPIRRMLDLNTWSQGADMATLYPKLRQIIADGVEQERRVRNPIREQIFPQLRPGMNATAPKAAGVYQMDETQIKEVHRGLLFNGATECCDGTILAHNSLVLSVVQIGISLVAYQGTQGTWVHRLYRRDMYAQMNDPVEEAMALLKRRGEREADNSEAPRDPLTRLMRRAMMDWAERAALCRLSTALWRMGHGNPISQNLLMPISAELVADSIEVMQRLLLDHKRFVFVASEPADRLLETIGDALHPLEFAVVDTLEHQFSETFLTRMADSRRGHRAETERIAAFVREIRSEVVTGVYRAGENAPARVFYAHKDFACEAAALAMADSVLQAHRGFPMLIDLADLVCGNTFDSASFTGTVHDAYAAAGEPTRYLGERETRS